MSNTTDHILILCRSIVFSSLAPISFFYSLWICNFATPFFFLVWLALGYSFGTASAALEEYWIVLGLNIIGIFFILLYIFFKTRRFSKSA